ncbi:MAG: CotH kinase family protein, partial [Fibrobacter sp.]|nr:CotH kinase family protein [Fibrobacter sp.]
MGGFGGMGGFGSSGTTGWQIENSSKQIADGNGGGGMWGGFGGSSLKAPRWLTSMWKNQSYQSELKKRWAELRSGVWHTKTMDAYLDSMKVYLKNAADRNFERWPNLGKSSGQNDNDPQPMKYCNQSGGGMGMAMGGYNADTWDGEVEHLRKKMKERMAWMDEQLGFTEPANPIVTEPVIHIPTIEDKKDTVSSQTLAVDYSRLSPTNFFVVNGSNLEIQTDIGGTFAIMDLNGAILYKTRIQVGSTSMKVPVKAQNKHWIAILNGKMLSR